MAPMPCRSPTNFLRWQDRSVQFEEPQFLSWKIPSLDQQCDRTATTVLVVALSILASTTNTVERSTSDLTEERLKAPSNRKPSQWAGDGAVLDLWRPDMDALHVLDMVAAISALATRLTNLNVMPHTRDQFTF